MTTLTEFLTSKKIALQAIKGLYKTLSGNVIYHFIEDDITIVPCVYYVVVVTYSLVAPYQFANQ